MGGLGEVCVFIRPEDGLGHAFAITEVDEDNATVVTGGVDPASKGHGLADVLRADGVAV
jgi:hypothetical protein